MQKTLLAAVLALAAQSATAGDRRELVVYTYDSFVSEWGPGPTVREAFEKVCDCDLKFVGAGDGAALLARVRLEGARSKADVVLGLDTALMADALDTGLFAPHGLEVPALDLPLAWADDVFVPYDWGWFAFVYDSTKLENPPRSFDELIASDTSIVIQDPRSSTPGLGLLMWVKAAYGDRAPEIWAGLAPRIVTVTPGWTEAYGLFLEGEADMTLSYTTSPAYHLIAEDDESKAAAQFSEGHYMQVETAAAMAGSDQPDLAREFLAFLLGPEVQNVIPTTNWMYPARLSEAGLPEGFETLVRPEKSLFMPPQEARDARAGALDEWLAALSR